MGLSSFSSVLIALVSLQGPGTRATYRIRIMEPGADTSRVLASGAVSGPLDNELRLTLRTVTAEVEALFHLTPFGDTVSLGAEFFTRRLVGRSRRGLPLWEEDSYQRLVRLAWSDTARIYPFGERGGGRNGGAWVELVLERRFAGGEGRASEWFELADSTRDLRIEAVVRPRRARVILNLVRGDTVSGPRGIDLVVEEPPRIVQLVSRGRATSLMVSVTRPEPPNSPRDGALAVDADVLCLRVASTEAGPPQLLGTVCGRLINVARLLPLPTGDTLAATFAWPGAR